MRHPAKRKRRAHGTKPTPRSNVVRPRKPPTNTKHYRGPAGSVVVWNRGRFIIKTTGKPHGFARLPKGLEERVLKAIEKGRVDVWVTN